MPLCAPCGSTVAFVAIAAPSWLNSCTVETPSPAKSHVPARQLVCPTMIEPALSRKVTFDDRNVLERAAMASSALRKSAADSPDGSG